MDNKIVAFEKYQGAGSDYIVIDNTKGILNGTLSNSKTIKRICDRQKGIGANGIVLVKSHAEYDFEVVHYNSDSGKVGCLCGNGSRIAVRFVHDAGILRKEHTTFMAYDGPHRGKVLADGSTKITFRDVNAVEVISEDEYFIDTGSPHHVKFVDDLNFDIAENGFPILNSEKYADIGGTNVMFAKKTPNKNNEIEARPFERAVQGETDSCGTGAIAISMALAVRNSLPRTKDLEYNIRYKGGLLKVNFDYAPPGQFTNVWSAGPTTKVYEGLYKLSGY